MLRERKPTIPKAAYGIAAIAFAAVSVAWALGSLTHGHAGVVVDKSTVVTDVAIRGTLVRSVSAQGAFAPERVRVVPATQPGVVNAIFVKPGNIVRPGTVIAQMQNPAVQAANENAESALQVARANLTDARQQVRASVIGQQSSLDDARAQEQSDSLQAASYKPLYERGLLANLQYQQARIQARKSTDQVRSRAAQLGVVQADGNAKIAAAQAQVEQAAAQVDAARSSVDALTVRAGVSGIVQSVDVDPGTSVAPNTEIARIAGMRDLKAVLEVAEADVHFVEPGMQANIDTGNGIVQGRVSRIAPMAQNGTVSVDVTFPRAVPAGARPDESVNGTIVIARIRDAISIARPAGAADGDTLELFKVVDGATRAVRIRARLGQGSSDRVQVLSGVARGDTVIVSDTSNYSDQSELRLR